jgi:hypothetical protein
MAYPVKCAQHGVSSASDILNLIEAHTDKGFGDDGGIIVCPICKAPASVFKRYKLQEKDRTWDCWIKRIVRIPSEFPTYTPYVLFTTGEEAGTVYESVMISYYKDTRKEGGRLKHGHGPGGPAALTNREIHTLAVSDQRQGHFVRRPSSDCAGRVQASGGRHLNG